MTVMSDAEPEMVLPKRKVTIRVVEYQGHGPVEMVLDWEEEVEQVVLGPDRLFVILNREVIDREGEL